jgi:hypothetical protein
MGTCLSRESERIVTIKVAAGPFPGDRGHIPDFPGGFVPGRRVFARTPVDWENQSQVGDKAHGAIMGRQARSFLDESSRGPNAIRA